MIFSCKNCQCLWLAEESFWFSMCLVLASAATWREGTEVQAAILCFTSLKCSECRYQSIKPRQLDYEQTTGPRTFACVKAFSHFLSCVLWISIIRFGDRVFKSVRRGLDLEKADKRGFSHEHCLSWFVR